MVSGRYKSGRFRKVFRKTPGGRVVVHYRNRKPNKAKCANCGAVLNGVPRDIPSKFRNLAKSKKRPERPYGGFLCSKCTRSMIRAKFK